MAKKILIVDDDPNIVLLVRTYLQHKGYEIVSAADGMEAIEKAKAEKPDVMIMDILMPRLDGYQAAERIRALGPHFRRMPIIIITVKEKLEVLFENLKIASFLAKPFRMEELEREVLRVLSLENTQPPEASGQ